MFKKILLATLIASSFASVPLIASDAQRTVVIREAPPPPREEVMPAAASRPGLGTGPLGLAQRPPRLGCRPLAA